MQNSCKAVSLGGNLYSLKYGKGVGYNNHSLMSDRAARGEVTIQAEDRLGVNDIYTNFGKDHGCKLINLGEDGTSNGEICWIKLNSAYRNIEGASIFPTGFSLSYLITNAEKYDSWTEKNFNEQGILFTPTDILNTAKLALGAFKSCTDTESRAERDGKYNGEHLAVKIKIPNKSGTLISHPENMHVFAREYNSASGTEYSQTISNVSCWDEVQSKKHQASYEKSSGFKSAEMFEFVKPSKISVNGDDTGSFKFENLYCSLKSRWNVGTCRDMRMNGSRNFSDVDRGF